MADKYVRYLEAVYDHAGGRVGVEVNAWEILERVGLTRDEDGTEGHQIRGRLRDAGLVVLHPPLSQKVVLTEKSKDEIEHRRGL